MFRDIRAAAWLTRRADGVRLIVARCEQALEEKPIHSEMYPPLFRYAFDARKIIFHAFPDTMVCMIGFSGAVYSAGVGS